MKLVDYDNRNAINFYIENGLEFDENKDFFGNNVKSFAIIENEKIIGAFSISIYKNKSFIEALAIDIEYRKKKYGKLLVKEAIKRLKKPIYTISKADEFYLKNGFIYDNEDLIDKECKTCDKYNISCFPKVVVYK